MYSDAIAGFELFGALLDNLFLVKLLSPLFCQILSFCNIL